MDVLECATDGRHAVHVACVIARIIGDSRQRASWMQLGRPDVEADRAVSIEPPSDLRARTALLGDIERRTRREVGKIRGPPTRDPGPNEDDIAPPAKTESSVEIRRLIARRESGTIDHGHGACRAHPPAADQRAPRDQYQ